MIAFIDGHRQTYGLEPICKVLPIAPSTYHAPVARRSDPDKHPARTRSDAALRIEIRRVFEANFCVYGVRKVWRQPGREGIVTARCTVPSADHPSLLRRPWPLASSARLMRTMELRGAVRGKTVRTTIPDPAAACPLDRAEPTRGPRPRSGKGWTAEGNRQFQAPKPNAL